MQGAATSFSRAPYNPVCITEGEEGQVRVYDKWERLGEQGRKGRGRGLASLGPSGLRGWGSVLCCLRDPPCRIDHPRYLCLMQGCVEVEACTDLLAHLWGFPGLQAPETLLGLAVSLVPMLRRSCDASNLTNWAKLPCVVASLSPRH